MYYWAGVVLMVSVLSFHAVNADQNIIISKGLIVKLCSDTCQQSSEKSLVEDCQRGCRFYDYAQSSNIVESNETAFHNLCVDSCKDAYTTVSGNQDACVAGCNNAKEEVDRIVQVGNQLLEEADKQMNFLNSIMDMMSSAFWSNENDSSEEDNEISKAVGQLIDGNGQSKANRLDKQMDSGDVEIITLLGNELDQAQASFCYTRMWLHRLSFILIVLGALSLFFISFFYILAVIKHKKAQTMNVAQLSAEEPMSNPPSYETLVKNGYIVVDANDVVMAPVHGEMKKEKLLL